MLDLLISGILGLIMFSIGMSLRLLDFQRLFAEPKVLLLGLLLQLIYLPLIAWSTCQLLSLPAVFSIGIMILAACPGGLTSNFISYLLKGNTALAVSLTICNSMLSMISIPIIVNLALAHFGGDSGLGALPILPTVGRIFALVLLPVLAGILFRRLYRGLARWLQPLFRWLSIFLLAFLFAVKLLAPAEGGGSVLTLAEVAVILPASLLVNVLSLLAGRVVAGALGFGRNDQLTLGVEVGIQNTSLAFLIAGVLLHNEQMLKPALVYAMFTFFTALAYGLLLKPKMIRKLRKEWRELRFTSR